MSTRAVLDAARRDLERMAGCVGVVKGIATAYGPSSSGRINYPDGMQLKVPLPLCWRHEKAIGWVREAALVRDEIHIVGEIADPEMTDDPALAERLRFAWREISEHRAKAFSIGPTRTEYLKGLDGVSQMVYADIGEISVCYRGKNPRAIITHAFTHDPPPLPPPRKRDLTGALFL